MGALVRASLNGHPFRAVGFDYNGTLLNDAQRIYQIVMLILQNVAIEPMSFQEFQDKVSGKTLRAFFKHFGMDLDDFEVQGRIKTYGDKIPSSQLQDGARDILRLFRTRKIPMALVSRLEAEIALRELKKNRIDTYFDSHIYVGVPWKVKPLRSLRREFGCKPGEMLYIGDTKEDMDEARQAGCYAVALTAGYGSPDRLRKGNPDLYVASWADFSAMLHFEKE